MSFDLGQKMPPYESHFYMPAAAVMQIALQQTEWGKIGGNGGYEREVISVSV